jgi:uracil-DNA glycosylase family 4
MLAAIGLNRETAYITNMIPWRPPGNRTPAPTKSSFAGPSSSAILRWLRRKIVVMLGNVASKSLLNTDKGILSLRGNWMECTVGRHRSLLCRPCIRPICCETRRRSGWSGLILALQQRLEELKQR